MARVLITNFHPKGGGGHVPYIMALSQLSEAKKHIIGIATPHSSRLYKYLQDISYPYLYACDFPGKIQKELPSILSNIIKFKKIIKDFKPDIVHTNGGADLFIAMLSRSLLHKYKIIRTHHAINSISRDPYHKFLYANIVDANIYVSNSSKEISTSTGLCPSKSVIIENGIDITQFKPSSKNLSLSRQFGINDNTLCFGSCAGTGNYKRVDIIIKAASTIKNYNYKIIVLGEKESGERLQKLASQLGVTQFIYCGFEKDVKPIISLFDVGFVLSDSIETISFAAREMMAMGKPLISSSFSGLKENVVHKTNGLLVRPGNIEDVSIAMTHFLEMTKDELMNYSINARNYAENHFDIRKQLADHSDLYSNLFTNIGTVNS